LKTFPLTTMLVLLCAGAAYADDVQCDQERSRQEVARLTQARTIISVDVFMPNVTVVVEERAWQRADMAQKRALAGNVDCATAGPDNKMLRSVAFRSNRSNKQLGVFARGELTVQ
jgi:hypothetical protein